MVEVFNLQNTESRFKFVFQLYNFVSLAKEDNRALHNSNDRIAKLCLDVKGLKLPALTTLRKRKAGDCDDIGNRPPKRSRITSESTESDVLSELEENEILSDEALMKELERAGGSIPPEVDGFRTLLPVRVFFP